MSKIALFLKSRSVLNSFVKLFLNLPGSSGDMVHVFFAKYKKYMCLVLKLI